MSDEVSAATGIDHEAVSRDVVSRTLRVAQEAGGIFHLPVSASGQTGAMDLAPSAEAMALPTGAVAVGAAGGGGGGGGNSREVIPTGVMPPPSGAAARKGKWASYLATVSCRPACCRKAASTTPVKSREYKPDDHMLTAAQVSGGTGVKARRFPLHPSSLTPTHPTFFQLAARYQTGIDATKPAASMGLTSAEAEKRLREYGPNRLSPPVEVCVGCGCGMVFFVQSTPCSPVAPPPPTALT